MSEFLQNAHPFPAFADIIMSVFYQDFPKRYVHAVLELCTQCKYLHMRIELLFHVFFFVVFARIPLFNIVESK